MPYPDNITWWVRDAANSICGQNGAKAHQDKLHEAADKLEATRKAADAILAPMTMEFGRALIESPESDINIECEGYSVTLKAKQFMALYWATA